MSKLALAIHDLSCYAKSSLTVVLPVLEALSVECAVLPTALLSTQTDGFDSLYFQDETDAMKEIAKKHDELKLEYDGIYSGFLGSVEQVEIVESIIKKHNALSLVDPVLGDNGALYQTMTERHVDAMKELVRLADIITPNYTEAGLLMGKTLPECANQRDIKEIVDALLKLGPDKGVVTSVPLALGSRANIAYQDGTFRIFSFDELNVSYPGAGDLFASILFSLILNGKNFFLSSQIATQISTEAVRYAHMTNRERRMGISLVPVFDEIKRRML